MRPSAVTTKHFSRVLRDTAFAVVVGVLAVASLLPSLANAGTLSEAERDSRIAHAHELLGSHYNKSAVRAGENVDKINQMIYHWTHDALPDNYKKVYKKVAQTIIDESLKNGFDPIFVMSVIMNESTFKPTTVGPFGEIGLMQIRPQTAQWIGKKQKMKFKNALAVKKALQDPCMNIKLGTAYLAYLRERFDSHARLYLAAYNMGQGNVEQALSKNIWPKIYAIRVMNHYVGYYREIRDKYKAKAGLKADTKLSQIEVPTDRQVAEFTE
jgi:soluble lytic murein transglycosylase